MILLLWIFIDILLVHIIDYLHTSQGIVERFSWRVPYNFPGFMFVFRPQTNGQPLPSTTRVVAKSGRVYTSV